VRVTDSRGSFHVTDTLEQAGITVSSIRTIVPTLEDVYIERVSQRPETEVHA
jgi:hypothetical protein